MVRRVQEKLEKAGIKWDLHLFADTVNSNASDIATIIQKTAQKVDAEILVLARHDKVCRPLPLTLGKMHFKDYLCFSIMDSNMHVQVKQGYFGPGSVARVCESLPLPLALIP